jgi:hypothetical protein
MGQYQQWLFAQEVERRLQAEVETLETELLYLRDRITVLEQSVPETENMILQALLEHLQDQVVPGGVEGHAQSGWSGLPRLETPRAQAAGTTPYTPRMDADMRAFFDRPGQADPQLSAWLSRTRTRDTETADEQHWVDEETQRLNENIQRWFVRWHRQITNAEDSEEVRDEQ